jgi:hypothetical protein
VFVALSVASLAPLTVFSWSQIPLQSSPVPNDYPPSYAFLEWQDEAAWGPWGLEISDVDLNGVQEIMVGGLTHNGSNFRIYDGLTHKVLVREKLNDAWHYEIEAGNVNDDALKEIVLPSAGGYTVEDAVMILQWDGSALRQIWRSGTAIPETWELKLADIDGDGRQEIITISREWTPYPDSYLVSHIFEIDYNSSSHGYDILDRWSGPYMELNGLNLYDFDADGHTEIIATGPLGGYAWDSASMAVKWTINDTDIPGMVFDVGMTVGDPDGDGQTEIIANIFIPQNGTVAWIDMGTKSIERRIPYNWPSERPLIFDVDQDNVMEVILPIVLDWGNDAGGYFAVFDGKTAAMEFRSRDYGDGIYVENCMCSAEIGDVDADSDIEILVSQYRYIYQYEVNASAGPSPSLSYSPSSLDFGTLDPGSVSSKTFEVWNSGGDTLTYRLKENVAWITGVNPDNGSSSGEHDLITVTVDTTGLAGGLHTDKVFIGSNGGNGSVDVTVRVNSGPVIHSFTASPSPSFEGDTVVFTVDATDPDGDPLTYRFDFESDGTFDIIGPGNTAAHAWGDDFVGKAIVQVTDGRSNVEANTTVTVLNVLPSGTVTVVNSTEEEGTPIVFAAHITDPGSDDVFLIWTWGDYTPDEYSNYYNDGVNPDPYPSPDIHPRNITDAKSHMYGDNGAFTVTVSVRDDDSGLSGTMLTITATPDNLPPSVSVSGGTNIDEGQSISLTATATDPGSDDLRFEWSWGEGSSDSKTYYNNGVGPDPPNSPDGTFPFTATDAATHAYGDDGAYMVTLKVTDDDGGSTSWSGQVTVNNLPPTIKPFGPFSLNEGDPFTIETNVKDPGSDDLTFNWTFELGPTFENVYYNDGIGPDPPQSPGGIYPFAASDSAGHAYGDNGIYLVTLTVTDDDGGFTSYSTEVNVSNLPPVIIPFGPFEVSEGDPLSITASAVDQGSDDLSFMWVFEYGLTVQNIHCNDGIGPDPPKSPNGVFPFSTEDVAAHTYGDDGVFNVHLRVEDDDGGVAEYETAVTVLNVAPTILDLEAFMIADITLRVAGEKWHDVILRLYTDGNETGYAQVIRYPGSPDDQSVTLRDVEVSLSREFTAVAYYTPDDDPVNGQPSGANPAWLTISWENGMETTLSHTFNVHHNDTFVWIVDDFHLYAPNQIMHFRAAAIDPGSDDLTFTWEWGDGTPATATTYFNDGIGSDPYPSPGGTFPFTARDSALHVFSMAGACGVRLTVSDDDGGQMDIVFVLEIG